MKCALCGHEFDEEQSGSSCKGCPLSGACNMVRCPNCGYEVPRETSFRDMLKTWRKRLNGIRRKS